MTERPAPEGGPLGASRQGHHAPRRVEVTPSGPLRGSVQVPGDKSVSHRALLLNALAPGSARLRGVLDGADVRATRAAVEALGVEVTGQGGELVVRAPAALREPADVIDCGNSGTSMRLLAGVVAGEPFFTALTGDASLRRRPMARVLGPLRQMGAVVDGAAGGTRAPLAIRGGALAPASIDLPVASAQLKSAVLLAGRRCGVSVREPGPSRDHTERMLLAMGASLRRADDGALALAPGEALRPLDVDVPGDISSAAFWMVAASVVPGSEVLLRGVGVNPTRTGVIDALVAMGAELEVTPRAGQGSEPIADVLVRSAALRATRLDGDLVVRALDELPVLAVAAAFAEGVTEIRDAAELRVKESDRIARVASGLRALGVEVEELPDGMRIQGGAPRGPAAVDATGDHRIAMAFAVAAFAAPGGVTISGVEEIGTSYPGFFDDLAALTGRRAPGAGSGDAQAPAAGERPSGGGIAVAVDGPAASGKGTAARAVARALGYAYLDTGAMYRAVALLAQRRGVSWHDGAALGALAAGLAFSPRFEGDALRMWVDGEDVSDAIRAADVGTGASVVSQHPEVRQALLATQRAAAARGGVVMDGRDIGTVVLPDAALKVFLIADPTERARRRHAELVARGQDVDVDTVLADLVERDRRDAERDVAPLRPADDAVTLDSTGVAPDAIAEQLVALARARGA